MSRKERTEREWKNRRNDIIVAAEKLFFLKGYEHTTVDDIVKEAEFSKSTVYNYIRSKEELFLLVHLRGLRKRKAIIQAMDTEESGYDKLYLFGRQYYEFYRKYPEYLRLQLYWSVHGIAIDKIDPRVVEEFRRENEESLSVLEAAFRQELGTVLNKYDIDLSRIVSYYLQTLRIVLNQSIFPVDPFDRYCDADYYFRYLNLFMLGIRTLNQVGFDVEVESGGSLSLLC
jgi:AcrR family transcriptional regulator